MHSIEIVTSATFNYNLTTPIILRKETWVWVKHVLSCSATNDIVLLLYLSLFTERTLEVGLKTVNVSQMHR